MRASCPNTRVVAFSVYEDRSAVFEMLQAGAIAYLVKGADASDMVQGGRAGHRRRIDALGVGDLRCAA